MTRYNLADLKLYDYDTVPYGYDYDDDVRALRFKNEYGWLITIPVKIYGKGGEYKPTRLEHGEVWFKCHAIEPIESAYDEDDNEVEIEGDFNDFCDLFNYNEWTD